MVRIIYRVETHHLSRTMCEGHRYLCKILCATEKFRAYYASV